MTYYLETDCTITLNGNSYTAYGAMAGDTHAIAYISSDYANVTDWHGNVLGPCRIVAKWRMFNYYTARCYQVEARINGVYYTGRSLGAGMIWRGRRKAQQRFSPRSNLA